MSWKSIINLYNTDILNPGCLRVCRKIKEKHIRPNNFQKMSVKGMAVVYIDNLMISLPIDIPIIIYLFNNKGIFKNMCSWAEDLPALLRP